MRLRRPPAIQPILRGIGIDRHSPLPRVCGPGEALPHYGDPQRSRYEHVDLESTCIDFGKHVQHAAGRPLDFSKFDRDQSPGFFDQLFCGIGLPAAGNEATHRQPAQLFSRMPGHRADA